MLKFVNEGAVSYEQRAVSRELLEKCSQLIAHRSPLKAKQEKSKIDCLVFGLHKNLSYLCTFIFNYKQNLFI